MFRHMMKEMDLKNPEAIDKEELEVLSTSVNPVRLKNNSVDLDYNTIVNSYKNVITNYLMLYD